MWEKFNQNRIIGRVYYPSRLASGVCVVCVFGVWFSWCRFITVHDEITTDFDSDDIYGSAPSACKRSREHRNNSTYRLQSPASSTLGDLGVI